MNLSPRNLLLVLVLAVVLVYGGLKGFIYHKYKTAVDRFSQQVQLFATVQYDNISSSLLDKSVSINNVSILPANFEEGINIDAITLRAPDYGFLLKGFNTSRHAELPDALQMELKGFKLDLYGGMLDQLEKVLTRMNAFTGISSECGNVTFMGPSQYREMGYDIINSDIHLGYKLYPGRGLRINYEWLTHDMASMEMDVWVSGINQLSQVAIQRSEPYIREVSMTYTDLSYTTKSNEYCAKASKRSVADYIKAETNQSDIYYAQKIGIVPGPGLKQAYRDFLTSPGTIKVHLQPPNDLDKNALSLYKPEILAELLNLKLEVNDKPVTDLSFRFINAGETQSLQERMTNFQKLLQDKDAVIEPPKPKVQGPPPAFHVVAANQLGKFMNHKIRVTMDNKQVREGYLIQLKNNTAYVGQNIHGGEFTMNIRLSDAKKIEVFYAK